MLLNLGQGRVSFVELPACMEPKDFCREWFSVSESDENVWGYRTKCVKLLAEIIGVKTDTVDRWGDGVDFAKMPSQYKKTLKYAMTICRVIRAVNSESEDILTAVLDQLRSEQN